MSIIRPVYRASDGTACELTGPQDAPAVILIHGLGLCRHLWTDYLPALHRHYRVLNYDLYGHGDSRPAPRQASLTVYSEQLVGLMDELHIQRAALLGFSIGGMINRRVAIDYSDRVSALAILNSPHDRGRAGQQAVEQRAAQVAADGALATMQSALQRWFTAGFRARQPQVLQRVIEWRERVDPSSYAQAAWVLAAGVKELTREKLPISVPTLVLTCENDSGSTPAMSQSICDQIVDSELQIVPQLQHLGLLEQPQQFLPPLMKLLEKIDND